MRKTAMGDESSPLREVSHPDTVSPETKKINPTITDWPNYRATVEDVEDTHMDATFLVTPEITTECDTIGTVQSEVLTNLNKSIFT